MELSGRDSLTLSTWLDDDQLHELPLMESDSDLFNSSMVSSAPILDHDDVNALFPMLSDSSFEYEGDQQLVVGDDPEFPPFESDLSPIFAAKSTPFMAHRHEVVSSNSKTKHQAATTSSTKVTVLTPRSKRKLDNTTNDTTITTERPTSASRKQRKALTPMNKPVVKTPEPQIIYSDNNDSFLTPVRSEQNVAQMKSSNNTGATAKRRRSASKNELPGLSTTWSEQEQSAFFSTFKNKWPVDERSSDESSSTITTTRSPSFSTMLLQRFDAISKKIKTKTMIEVRLFYTIVLSNISGLLKELDNDIDLTNPDEVRIAVWCWSKLLTDESHKKDFQNVATADPSVKKRLSHVLLQSIIRSRRQMLKAKSSAGYLYNSAPSVITHSKQHQQQQQQSIGRQSSTVVTSQSSVFSVLTNLSARSAAGSTGANHAEPAAAAAVVHHPMVRKKARAAFATSSSLQTLVPNPVVLAQQQQPQQLSLGASEVTNTKSALKRKRAKSIEAAVVVVDETPLKPKRQQLVHMEASFVSPAPTMGFSQQSQQHQSQKQRDSHHVTSQTPPQSSRKKISIKMRIVPMDKATKAHVVSTGCNPKVELKLTSTKRISEVAQHMAKKWGKARALVPADAMLQFYEKQEDGDVGADTVDPVGWSEKDRSVTCFDIWKRCGKKIKNENVVVVYYAWKSGGASGASSAASAGGLRKMSGSGRSEGESELDDLARSPGSLFAEEISLADLGENAVVARSLSSSSASLARGLQQFGESMAFHSSEFSDAALQKDVVQVEKKKLKSLACPLDALLDENDEEEEEENGEELAFVDCSPNTQQQRLRRRITPMLVAKEEFDL